MTTESAPPAPRRAFLLVLLAALLHGLCYLALVPPWMGEDEPWHLEYAHHIGSGHLPLGGQSMSGPSAEKLDDRTLMSLSQLLVRRRVGGLTEAEIAGAQEAILASMRAHHFWRRVPFAGWAEGSTTFDQIANPCTATHQPPLYYLVSGAILRVLPLASVEAELWALRCFSLLCYLALVACAFALGRLVSSDEWIALACALFVAWLPMHARQAAVVNNDVLAKVFAGLALVAGARILADRSGARGALWLGAAIVLGMLAKPSAAGALAMLFVALAHLAARRFGLMRGIALGTGALVLLSGAAAAFLYATHSAALPRRLSNLRHRLDNAFSAELRERLFSTFGGAFSWETRPLPGELYAALGALLALALAGLLWLLARGVPDVRRRVLLACAAAVVLQLLLVGLRGEGRGRYLFPVLPALGALIACGLLGPLAPRRRPIALAALALALVLYDAFFLWRGLLWNEYAWWGS